MSKVEENPKKGTMILLGIGALIAGIIVIGLVAASGNKNFMSITPRGATGVQIVYFDQVFQTNQTINIQRASAQNQLDILLDMNKISMDQFNSGVNQLLVVA